MYSSISMVISKRILKECIIISSTGEITKIFNTKREDKRNIKNMNQIENNSKPNYQLK